MVGVEVVSKAEVEAASARVGEAGRVGGRLRHPLLAPRHHVPQPLLLCARGVVS